MSPRDGALPVICPGRQKKRRPAATDAIDRFLDTASRRHAVNLALEYTAIAIGVAAIGAVILLIVGTQVLNWYWPALLFAAGVVAGAWRAYKRRLSRYRLAQVVDSHLGLQDRLSTAIYFRSMGDRSHQVLQTVERQAEERIRSADVTRAVPLVMPRQGYAAVALVLAAFGMLGVRYGVLHTLDLSAPLARIDMPGFNPAPPVHAASNKSAIQERFEQQLKDLGLTVDDLDAGEEQVLEPQEIEIPATSEEGAPNSVQKGTPNGQTPPSEGAEDGETDESMQGESLDTASSDNPGQQTPQQGQQQPKQPEGAKQNQQPSPQNGLMNKMRDALANMLNKLKKPGSQGSEQQNAANQNEGQTGRQQTESQQGMESRNKSQGEGQPSPDQQGEQSEGGEQSASDRNRPGEKSADRPGGENSKSGMGQQDGEKAIRENEQLAAMGKISEIFGKRAQQLTGDVTVEVSSGKQQLKTAWSERRAIHADTSAESNRDEIPLAYQSYIQRYFEEVRKSPGPAKN